MYLLDTCSLSDFMKIYDKTLYQRLVNLNPKDIFISAITVDEVVYGLSLNPAKKKIYQPIYDEFIENIGYKNILPFTSKEAVISANIRSSLRKDGVTIDQYDIMIAAIAISQRLTLVTSNVKHFKHIDGLSFENWRSK